MVLMDFGCFSHLLKIYAFFKKCSKWVIFEQKAWAIAHGFDGFWVFFTPFENLFIFQKISKMGHFWAKSMDYSPWFWWILGVFHTFWEFRFSISKMFKMGHFWAKSMDYSPWFWWILGVFHTFWKILFIS